jgi:hypothetical protein
MKHLQNNPLTAFDAVQNSASFLNFIVQNTNSAVLLLDKEMKVQAYNESVKTMFTGKKGSFVLHTKCGECLGCVYTIDENKPCGNTSGCLTCELRNAALVVFASKKPIFKQRFEGNFYNKEHKKEHKLLQYSIKPVEFEKNEFLALLIEDISHDMTVKPKEQLTVVATEYWIP